jgi:hypothetical protein
MTNNHPATLLLALPFVVAIAPAFGNPDRTILRPDGAKTSAMAAHFVARATTANVPSPTSHIEILIQQWSTDDDRDSLRTTLVERGPGALLAKVQEVLKRPAGVVVIPGIPGAGARARTRQARNILFARDVQTAKGRQVIVVTDQYLAFGEPTKDWPLDPEFTVLDIRFGTDGNGVGKLAPPAKVVYNKETKMIELDNYAAEPVRLADVRSGKP